jgi:hypothetical protein
MGHTRKYCRTRLFIEDDERVVQCLGRLDYARAGLPMKQLSDALRINRDRIAAATQRLEAAGILEDVLIQNVPGVRLAKPTNERT